MKDQNILKIISQIYTFVRSEYPHGEADDGPQVHRVVSALVVIVQVVNLGMAVVTGCDAVGGPCRLYLIEFDLTKSMTRIRQTGLKEPAAPAAAVVVGSVGIHVDVIFFPHDRFHNKAKVFGHGITKTLTNHLAGVLNREFAFQFLVPVGIHLEFPFPDPLGVILNDAFNLEVIGNVEFLQSGPDRKQLMPSFRVEPDLAAQILHRLDLGPHNVFPAFIIAKEHAVVLRSPALGSVCPVCP